MCQEGKGCVRRVRGVSGGEGVTRGGVRMLGVGEVHLL